MAQDRSPEATCARLRVALEMFDDALDMLRLKLRRAKPHASDEEIEAEVAAWVSRRPGAEEGDFTEVAPPLTSL